MSVYKIFPAADATMYSRFPAQNTGLDEVLEVSVKNNVNTIAFSYGLNPNATLTADDLRRSVVRFSDSDLNKLKSFRTGSWQAGFKLYLANAENLSTTYSLEIRAVSSSWEMGLGKFADNPETINGVSWDSPVSYASLTNFWVDSQYFITPGGGNWTGSYATQSFDYNSSKDINANVTPIVTQWLNGSLPNNGFIIKYPRAVEIDSGSFIVTNFFSVDTHTIYPPTLEMKWDDSSYATGSLSVISNNQNIISIDNNTGTYKYNTEKYRFRVNSRDKYPARTFTTSSLYTTNKALPQASYWAIQDVKTEDIIIDFDTDYTKISCDSNGSYFDVYMAGLEPERYYRILIKVILPDGETIEVDNNSIFKIIR